MNIDELLELPGFTRDLLYGSSEALETAWESANVQERRERSPRLTDYVSVQAADHINLNTISTHVFTGLLKGVYMIPGDAEKLGEAFRLFRERLQTRHGAQSSILSVQQLSEAGIGGSELVTLMDSYRLGVHSNHFTIISTGEYKGYKKTIWVRVLVEVESYQIDPDAPEALLRRDRDAYGWIRKRSDTILDPVVRVLETKEI
jgi:hypothetical protein